MQAFGMQFPASNYDEKVLKIFVKTSIAKRYVER